MSAQDAGGQLEMAADFDDLEIGDTMITRGRTITESDLVGFSSLTGDWHPQHADAQWSQSSQFGERIAHGMMVVSYAVGLVPFDPERVVALRGLERVTFKRPTRMGDTIRVEVKVAEKKRLDPGHGLVGFKWRILNQDNKAAVLLRVEALWRTDEAAPPGGTSGSGTVSGASRDGASSGGSAAAGSATSDGLSLSPDNSGPRAVYL